MNTFALFRARLKATLRSGGAMSVFALALIIPLLLGLYSAKVSEGKLRVAVVNRDRGDLGRRLVEMVNADAEVTSVEMTEDQARRQMELDLLQCLFVIRPEFSERLEAREFDHLVDLTVAPGCTYGASVSEPLINGVMKLWFEQQTLRDVERLQGKAGVTFDAGQSAAVQKAMDEAWAGGAQVQVVYITEETGEETAPLVKGVFARTALSWFAALSLLFLILSGQWIGRFGQAPLQQRLRQRGMGFGRGFLTQSCAQLVMVYAGFLVILPAGGDWGGFWGMLMPALVYGAGTLGVALVICALCGELTSLLLFGPVLGMVVGFLSGLLMELPDWGRLWVLASGVLPGRQLYAAMDGGWDPPAALLASALWVALGLGAARLTARWKERRQYRYTPQGEGGT